MYTLCMPAAPRHRHDLGLSLIGGFAASFLAFSFSTYTQHFGVIQKGQLVAGDVVANRELPTTLNAFRSAADGSNPLIASLTSTSWWVAVMMGGFVAAFILFKWMRRYV